MVNNFKNPLKNCFRASSSPTPSSGSSHALTTTPSPLQTTVKWADKRSQKSVVMTADVENQAAPLVQNKEDRTMQILDEKDVSALLKEDKHKNLLDYINQLGKEKVWRPRIAVRSGHIFTTFHTAAKKGAKECMRVLLDTSPPLELLNEPNQDGYTPLMLAVQEGHPEVVDMLLKAKVNVCARNNKGHSVLHTIAYTIADNDGAKPTESLEETAKLLLQHEEVDLEPHNYSGYTPLFAAAKSLPKEDECLKGFCKSLVKAGASLEDKSKDYISNKSNTALADVLEGVDRGAPPSRPTLSRFLDLFTQDKSAQEIEEFLEGSQDSCLLSNCYLGSSPILFRAIDAANESLVQVLLDAKASTFAEDITQELPIYHAAAVGHVSIFECVVKSMKQGSKQLNLEEHSFHILKKLLENKKRRKRAPVEIDHSKCLDRLLQPDCILNVNQTFQGQTTLHEAIAYNNQGAASKLLGKGAFLGARRLVNGEDYGTVLNSLQLKTLENAMDTCITHYPVTQNESEEEFENVLSPNYTLKLDYGFLLPPKKTEKGAVEEINELETLMEIGRDDSLRRAITHPLMETLLYAKWRNAMPFYICNVVLYLIFVVLLGCFGYILQDIRMMEEKLSNSTNATTLSEEEQENLRNMIDEKNVPLNIIRPFLILLTLYMLVREAFQMYFNWSRYRKNIENLFECFLVVVVVILCTANLPVDSTRHLVAWSMIVAGYEFVLIMGRIPFLAIYITMMRRISFDFVKMILLYGTLFVAFAFSFYIILQPDSEEFGNFWSALPKSIVMATGEFDYKSEDYNFKSASVIFMSTIMVFLVFLFLVYLVVVNVLLGLAVEETKIVLEDQHLYFLLSRLELVYLIETFFRFCPGLKRFLGHFQFLTGPNGKRQLSVKPNERSKNHRISSKKGDSRLGNETADRLRQLRMKCIEQEEESSE